MKTPKPGQFCTINGVVYRGKERTCGCRGCALDDIILCPNIQDTRYKKGQILECSRNNIILVRA